MSQVQVPERVYEDWLVENVYVFGHDARIVARQKALPSGGVLDLLVLNADGLSVVEVKAIRATDQAILQLLRYVGEVGSDPKCPLPVHGVLAAPSVSPAALCATRGAGLEYLRLSAGLSAMWDHTPGGRASGVVIEALRYSLPSDTRPTLGAMLGPARHVAFRPAAPLFGPRGQTNE